MPALMLAVWLTLGSTPGEPSVAVPVPDAALPSPRATRSDHLVWHRAAGIATGVFYVAASTLAVFAEVSRGRNGPDANGLFVTELSLAGVAQAGVLSTYLLAFTAPARDGPMSTRTVVHQVLVFASGAMNVARALIVLVLMGQGSGANPSWLVPLHAVTAIAAPALLTAGGLLQVW